MKKIALSLALILASLVSAQTHYGAKAGYSLSNMKWKFDGYDDMKFDSKSYFYIGGFVDHFLNEKFAIQGELLYTELGGKTHQELTQIVGNEVVDMGTATYTFNYPQLQIPISAKYYFDKKFNILGGMNFGINLNPNVKSNFQINGSYGGKQENAKTLNLFPFLGAEYLITDKVSVDARYNFGVFNINKDGINTKISSFNAGLGYRFK